MNKHIHNPSHVFWQPGPGRAGNYFAENNEVSLAQVLKDGGYHTHMTGKVSQMISMITNINLYDEWHLGGKVHHFQRNSNLFGVYLYVYI